jgi:colanic acid/amylovoran biosynthesis glycosyltransferase
MKVAFLLRKFPVLSETFILDQIVGLIEQGVEVNIYALFEGDRRDRHPLLEAYHLLERARFPTVRCSESALRRLVRSPQLFGATHSAPFWQQFKSLNSLKYGRQARLLHLIYFSSLFNGSQSYDIIHCHFGMYGLVGVDLRDLELVQGKVVTSFHGMDIHVYPKLHGSQVYQRLFKQGDLFTVNSDFTGQRLVQLGCPAGKIAKLPVGLRTEQYSPATNSARTDFVNILTVARLTEKKGLEYSIRAIAQLQPQFPQIRYSIVGDGDLKEPLQQLIQNLHASHYIHLLGSRNQVELRQIYAQTDIFVLASVTAADGDMEGQGLVLQEAQASGIPVISTWHNGIPEGVLVEQSAFLVPEKDVSSLAEKIAYLITHPEQRQQMGQIGQAFVKRYFDLHILNEQLVSLYQTLL